MKNSKTDKIRGINSPIMRVRLTPTDKQVSNFLKKINFEAENGCWEWLAGKNKKGYGRCRSDFADGISRKVRAHRLAYVVFEQTQPLDQVVRHRCGNTSCVRPSHTKLGSMRDNWNDAVIDGTAYIGVCGEDHYRSRLTWDDVNEIRRAYREKEMTQRKLGERFGLHQANIKDIIHNKYWVDDKYEPPAKVNIPLTNAEKEKIKKLWAQGKSVREIAGKTGRAHSTVRVYLRK